jgi:NAD(P)H-dependent flavin oxidoreductase YrpB (nitropropane dioxygenase family)
MKNLIIGNLKAAVPIIQGGMGVGISLSGLSSSVANQGGIGVIATAGIGMMEPDFRSDFIESNIRALRKQIQKAKELSKGILGVNIMVALSNFSDMVKTAIEEKVDIIFSGAGLPLNLPEFLKGSKETKLVPIVSSGRAARILSQRWLSQYNYIPDAFVVEGPKAGGHLGFKPDQIEDPAYALENIVKDVVREVKTIEENNGKTIPVIAAGGIYTGKDIYEIMKLGVSGVQMATRFVPTVECDASPAFKKCYIDAKIEDISIIKSPVGMPGRAIINDFIKSSVAGDKKPFTCPYHCIVTCEHKNSPYCIALALMNAKNGNMKNGFAFAGQNAYRSTDIITVKALMDSLQREYREAQQQDGLTSPT